MDRRRRCSLNQRSVGHAHDRPGRPCDEVAFVDHCWGIVCVRRCPAAPCGARGSASASATSFPELVWRGAESATVIGSDGVPVGRLTIAAILAHGRAACSCRMVQFCGSRAWGCCSPSRAFLQKFAPSGFPTSLDPAPWCATHLRSGESFLSLVARPHLGDRLLAATAQHRSCGGPRGSCVTRPQGGANSCRCRGPWSISGRPFRRLPSSRSPCPWSALGGNRP